MAGTERTCRHCSDNPRPDSTGLSSWHRRVNGDEEVRARTRVLIDDITSAVADGTLRPQISERYPLARGAEALLAVRERRVSGRVTLNMDEGNNNP